MLERIIAQHDSIEIANVLEEAYFTSAREIQQDQTLRTRVIERLARAPAAWPVLRRFPAEEFAPIANRAVGTIQTNISTSQAFRWFRESAVHLDRRRLRDRIFHRTNENPVQFSELIFLGFMSLDTKDIARIAKDPALLRSPGPTFESAEEYSSQASIAVFGLTARPREHRQPAIYRVLSDVLQHFLSGRPTSMEAFTIADNLVTFFDEDYFAVDDGLRRELGAQVGELIGKVEDHRKSAANAAGRVLDQKDLERLRTLVRKLDPDLAAPLAGGEPSQRGPRARRRSSPRRKRSV